MYLPLPSLPRLIAVTLAVAPAVGLAAGPSITQQPADVTVMSGQNATFTVAATGTGTLTYQWRHSGFAIPGATHATFVWGGTTLGESGFYDVLVSDATGSSRSNVAQLTVTPSAAQSTVAADPRYALPLSADTGMYVQAIAASADGGYYIGGAFVMAGTVRRTLIAHVTAGGVIDPAFVPPEITGFYVAAIAVQADGKVVLGGFFNHVGNVRCGNLVRLNPDGSLDPSFHPMADWAGSANAIALQPDGKIIACTPPVPSTLTRYNPDGSVDSAIGGGLSGTVTAMAYQSDGKLIVAGMIKATVNGQAATSAVRLNLDGTIDPTFVAPAYQGYLASVSVAADGSIYLGGNPTYGSGQAPLVRLSATGAIDATFSPVFDGGINAVVLQPDGKVIVGGVFTSVNQIHHPFLARLNHNGSLDAFGSAEPEGSVRSLLLRPDGSVVVGFDFSANAPIGLERYLADGSLASTPSIALQAPAEIGDLVRLPGGKFAVVGRINHVGALATNAVVHLNADGSLDTSFVNADTAFRPISITQAVGLPDGRIAAAGMFYNLVGRSNAGAVLLKADGSFDSSFNQSWTIPLYGNAIAVTPDGKIVLGGNVSGAGSPGSAVMEYQLDGSPVPGFATAAQFDGNVAMVVAQRDGKILVGGYLKHFNSTVVNSLVRLNADGTLDAAFCSNLHVTSVGSVQVDAAGRIYLDGSWDGPDGRYAGLLRLNADGTRDASYHPDTAAGAVGGIEVNPDGGVLAWIEPVAPAAPYLARFNADGTTDAGFRAFGVDPEMRSSRLILLLRDDGHLLFLQGQQNGDRVQTTVTPTAPVVTTAPAGAVLPLGGQTTLQVTAASAISLAYQWQYNGDAIAGATDASYTVSNLSAANAGRYSVVVSNQLGSVTTDPVSVTTPLDPGAHLVNLSIRATASDSNPLVMGVVLGGSGTGGDTPLLLRAAGPTLTKFGVPGALADPVLELYDGTGFKIDQNDDWTGVFDFTSVGAFPFEGPAPKDAAIYNPYATTGAQTIHILGKAGASGVVLGEVYDATPGGAFTVTTPRIINGSARTQVGTGDNALILGFAVAGQGSVRVLVRAVGPTLAAPPFHLGGMLADPVVEIHAGDNTVVASNDNWSDNGAAATMSAAFDSVGAFHLAADSKDSAIIATLTPGIYSAVVRGVGNTMGSAMVELYVLP